MADTKITALTALTAADPANDVIPIVDVSDTSMAASGTTKKISVNNILGASGTATLASATITGDLTVDTSTLKVDSTNNRVGIGTASPSVQLHLAGTDTTNVLFAGVTKGIRFVQSASTSLITGVDNTGAASYQPLSIGGSALDFSLSGTTAMTLNSTGLGIGNVPVSGQRLTVEGGDIYLKSANKLTLDNASNNFGAQIYNIGASAQAALAFTLGATQAMTLDASGNLLVGKTASSTSVAGAQVQPDGTHSAVKSDANPGFFYNTTTAISGTVALFRSNGVTVGSISQDGTNTAYNLSSDYRLKEQVQPLVGGLARVNSLKPSIYKWKTNGSNGEGFLAHELAEVVPFAVTGPKDAMNEDGTINPQGVDLSKIVPILVAAIQELTAEVNALKNA